MSETPLPPQWDSVTGPHLRGGGAVVVWSPDPGMSGQCIHVPAGTTVRVGRGDHSHVGIDDPFLSREHLAIDGPPPSAGVPPHWTIRSRANATPVRINGQEIRGPTRAVPGDVIRCGATLFIIGSSRPPMAEFGIIGSSAETIALHAQIRSVATRQRVRDAGAHMEGGRPEPVERLVPVHVSGETGVGKDLVARAIHVASGRTGPFIARSLGAMPATLATAELFGHVKGAFTGGQGSRNGLFGAAEHGTLFLDEIGDIPAELQSTLLVAVETGIVAQVGSTPSRLTDVRIVTATNRDIRQAVREGSFRSDLWHRLSAAQITVAPLRTRVFDVVPLALHFIEQSNRDTLAALLTHPAGHYWMADVLERLLLHDWPGNVRELGNVVTSLFGSLAPRIISGGLPAPAQLLRTLLDAPARPHAAPPAHETETPVGRPSRRRAPLELGSAESIETVVKSSYHGNVSAYADALATETGLPASSVRRRIYDVLKGLRPSRRAAGSSDRDS